MRAVYIDRRSPPTMEAHVLSSHSRKTNLTPAFDFPSHSPGQSPTMNSSKLAEENALHPPAFRVTPLFPITPDNHNVLLIMRDGEGAKYLVFNKQSLENGAARNSDDGVTSLFSTPPLTNPLENKRSPLRSLFSAAWKQKSAGLTSEKVPHTGSSPMCGNQVMQLRRRLCGFLVTRREDVAGKLRERHLARTFLVAFEVALDFLVRLFHLDQQRRHFRRHSRLGHRDL